MENDTFWIATVSDEAGLHASGIVWGEFDPHTEQEWDMVPVDVLDAATELRIPVTYHGPFTLPKAA